MRWIPTIMVCLGTGIILPSALGQSSQIEVEYSYSADGSQGVKPVDCGLSNGFSITSKPGGCGLNDIAECQVSRNGEVVAFNRDSCDPRGVRGNVARRPGQCSVATFRGFTVKCCLKPGQSGAVLSPDPTVLSDSRQLLLAQQGISPELIFNGVYWQSEVWIAGTRYLKALGMHPGVAVPGIDAGLGWADFKIPAGAKSFSALFGLARQDSQPGGLGQAAGRVYVDGQKKWEGVVDASKQVLSLNVPLPQGSRTLRLEVDSLGTRWSDHTTWANPEFRGRP